MKKQYEKTTVEVTKLDTDIVMQSPDRLPDAQPGNEP